MASTIDQIKTGRTASVAEAVQPLTPSVYVALAGLACLPVGLLWDISHHSSIGRDSFWTPAHILIQLGGIVPALLLASLAFKTTFQGTPEQRNASVSFWGFRAPLGAWVTIWGAMAMVTSAPFDDWWHNRYGLDVKIVSPPHAVLGFGMLAVGMGVLLFIFSAENRAASMHRNTGLISALAVGVLIVLWADFATEFTWPNLQHTAHFYQIVSTPFPLCLVLAARASKMRASATLAAATYMAVYIAMILVLPLFPAQPKLAPIYHPVDHMVPPAFPLLLVVPALAIDAIEWLWGGAPNRSPQPTTQPAVTSRRRWWRDWLLALLFGAAFLGLIFAVQHPFARFLLSDAADNRFFARDGHWPYFAEPGNWMNTFWDLQKDPVTPRGLAWALLRAFISARIGLALGNYLLRLRR